MVRQQPPQPLPMHPVSRKRVVDERVHSFREPSWRSLIGTARCAWRNRSPVTVDFSRVTKNDQATFWCVPVAAEWHVFGQTVRHGSWSVIPVAVNDCRRWVRDWQTVEKRRRNWRAIISRSQDGFFYRTINQKHTSHIRHFFRR